MSKATCSYKDNFLQHLGRFFSSKSKQFSEVFAKEWGDIVRRRGQVKLWTGKELETSPSTDHCLAGLALSGGGIRSATFCLGVIQALQKHGLLKFIDYLSTVSGGGYIGSCLSSIFTHSNSNQVVLNREDFPLHNNELGETKETLAVSHLRNSGNYLAPGGALNYFRMPAVLLRGILLNVLAFLPYVIAFVGLVHLYHNIFVVDTFGISFLLSIIAMKIFIAMALLFFFLYQIVHCVVKRFKKNTLNIRDRYSKWAFGFTLILVLCAVSFEALVWLLRWFSELKIEGESKGVSVDVWTGLITVASAIASLLGGKILENLRNIKGKIMLLIVGLLGPVFFVVTYLYVGYWVIYKEYHSLYMYGGLVWLLSLYFLNANLTSMHGFYRDRLSKAYLFDPVNIEPTDDLKLSDLTSTSKGGPYHIINATLNLQGAEHHDIRGKHAEFFVFSKHFSGSERTGYIATSNLEEKDAHLNLGTAMAISGAALAPNMGIKTVKPLVFVLTLLNARLGYWIPNPNLRYSSLMLTSVGPIYLILELLGALHDRSNFVNLSDGGHIENLGVYQLLKRKCKFIILCDAEADPDMTFEGFSNLQRLANTELGIKITINLDDLRPKVNGLSKKHCAIGIIEYNTKETGYLLYIKSSVTEHEVEYIDHYRSEHPQFPHETTADQFFDGTQFEVYRSLGYHIAHQLIKAVNTKVTAPESHKDLNAWFEQAQSILKVASEDPCEKLKKLLKGLGVLTEEEFKTKKKELLKDI
ncbi:MAG: patatin-like phospholipase family protein [Planctomycetota bacterium]|jgi:hypothetical protein